MRRSGNSSCLLLPKSNEESDEGNNDQPTVTMVTTKRLPEYSIERYYMLSEIEEHSNSIIFLDDWTRASQMTMVDKTKGSDVEDIRNVKNPSHVILYMLWQPYTYSSCRDFIESVVIKNVARIGSLVGNDDSRDSLKLYLLLIKYPEILTILIVTLVHLRAKKPTTFRRVKLWRILLDLLPNQLF